MTALWASLFSTAGALSPQASVALAILAALSFVGGVGGALALRDARKPPPPSPPLASTEKSVSLPLRIFWAGVAVAEALLPVQEGRRGGCDADTETDAKTESATSLLTKTPEVLAAEIAGAHERLRLYRQEPNPDPRELEKLQHRLELCRLVQQTTARTARHRRDQLRQSILEQAGSLAGRTFYAVDPARGWLRDSGDSSADRAGAAVLPLLPRRI
jgi:hypothetical protein